MTFHKISGVTETKRVRWTERAQKYEGNVTLEALVITTPLAGFRKWGTSVDLMSSVQLPTNSQFRGVSCMVTMRSRWAKRQQLVFCMPRIHRHSYCSTPELCQQTRGWIDIITPCNCTSVAWQNPSQLLRGSGVVSNGPNSTTPVSIHCFVKFTVTILIWRTYCIPDNGMTGRIINNGNMK